LTAAVPATAEAADNRIEQRRRLRVLPAVMVVQLTAVMAGVVVATAGPAIAADLHGLRLYPWLFSSYALTYTEQPGAWPAVTVASLVLAVAAFVGLLRQESRTAAPFISLAMFRNEAFLISVLTTFFLAVVNSALVVYVPLYVQNRARVERDQQRAAPDADDAARSSSAGSAPGS
jgi:hypothetical protein